MSKRSRKKKTGPMNYEEANTPLEKFGAALRAKRQDRAMRSGKLAAKVGITAAAVSNIERGKNYPGLPVYADICEVLNLGRPPLM